MNLKKFNNDYANEIILSADWCKNISSEWLVILIPIYSSSSKPGAKLDFNFIAYVAQSNSAKIIDDYFFYIYF